MASPDSVALRLVPAAERDVDDRSIYGMLQDLPPCENGFSDPARGLSFEEYGDFIRGRIAHRHGLELPEGRVPESWFWLFEGDLPIGFAKLRHRLDGRLRARGGHIGYGVRASMRGRGYGTQLLRLALEEARSLDLKEVVLTCDAANAPSRRVIEKNGGILLDELDERLIFLVSL